MVLFQHLFWGLHVFFVWLQYRHPSNQYKIRLWLKVQAGIWPATCLESLHPTLLGSKRAVVNAHQEMFWGWSIFTEIKVESTDVKQAIGVAISQWLHSSMCFVSEGNNSHKNMYSETCIEQKFWGDQMAWLSMWNHMKVAYQLAFQTIPACFFFFLPSSSIFPPFMLFSYLVAPLPVLSFQEAKMFRCWCPYKIFKPLFLIHLKPLLATFSLYFCARNSWLFPITSNWKRSFL